MTSASLLIECFFVYRKVDQPHIMVGINQDVATIEIAMLIGHPIEFALVPRNVGQILIGKENDWRV